MADLPRITVIICCHNHAAFVDRALQSLLDQSYPDLELMVVDAESSDGSKAIIERYADRLHWWCSERDEGQAHALNKALAEANVDRIDEDICCFRLHPGQKSSDAELASREEREIIEPLLWNPNVSLDRKIRRRLQADWLYHSVFLSEVQASVERGDSKWKRWLKLLKMIAAHPKVLTSKLFLSRIKAVREKGERGSSPA